jgi:hypothetical protein
MKPLAAALLVTNVLASSPTIVERDATAITNDIASTSNTVSKLNDKLGSNVQASDYNDLMSDSQDIIKAIKQGTSDANSSPMLQDTDALALVNPVQNLAKLVNTTVDNLISQKSTIDGFGDGSAVEQQLMDQQSAANAFQSALIAKVPSGLQSTANGLAQPISDSLAQGVAANKGDTSSSSSSSSPKSSAAESGSSTAAMMSPSTASGTSSGTCPPTGYSTGAGNSTMGGAGATGTLSSSSSSQSVQSYTGAASILDVWMGGLAAAGLAAVAAL